MKKIYAIALVLVLTVCLFAGCRSRQNDTSGTTEMPNASDSNMLPDNADTISPTNGANQEPDITENTQATDASDPVPTEENSRSRNRIFPNR